MVQGWVLVILPSAETERKVLKGALFHSEGAWLTDL